MKTHFAYKLAKRLAAINVIIAMAIIPLGVKLSVDYFLPTQAIKAEVEVPTPKAPVEKMPLELDDMQICWTAPISQNKPPEIKKPEIKLEEKPKVEPPKQEIKKPEIKLELPFEIIAIVEHSSNSKKNYAILLDKRNQQQVLAREGKEIVDARENAPPNQPKYILVKITSQEIKIQADGKMATLEKTKSALEKFVQKQKSGDEKLSRVGEQESKVIINEQENKAEQEKAKNKSAPNENVVESVANKNSVNEKKKEVVIYDAVVTMENNRVKVSDNKSLAQHGLQNKDQIISIAGKRVNSLAQVETTISQEKNALAEVAILRNGKMLSLMLPIKK